MRIYKLVALEGCGSRELAGVCLRQLGFEDYQEAVGFAVYPGDETRPSQVAMRISEDQWKYVYQGSSNISEKDEKKFYPVFTNKK